MSTVELDDALHAKITAHTTRGEQLFKRDKHSEAIGEYHQAWQLLPDPKEDWEAATWILAAIGDSLFMLKRFEESRDAFRHAMHCPKAIGNPFLHLRLGQLNFELGDLDRSADELIRAYAVAGPEIFSSEDPKYLTFLGTRADLSPPEEE